MVGQADVNFINESYNEEIPFSISARVIYQLGEQLISDEYVALGELIKNSYDADCTNITISVDTKVQTPYGKGRIEISDNGNGMTKSIIEKSFLRISTEFKCVEKYSPFFLRRSLGEKGLGRLSIQRLGNHMELVTTPRLERLKNLKSIIPEEDLVFHSKYNTVYMSINWNDFANSNRDFSDIKTRCQYFSSSSPIYGTKLIISGIRNLGFWYLDAKMKTRIRSEIFGMVNPFIQYSDEKFEIELNIDGTKFTNAKIDETVLNVISDVDIMFTFNKWVLDLKIKYKRKYLERLANSAIYRMYNYGFTKSNIIAPFTDIVKQYTLDLSNEKFKVYIPYLEHIYFQQKSNKLIFRISDNSKVLHLKTDMTRSRVKANIVISAINKSSKFLAYPSSFEGVIYACEQSSESLKIMQYDLQRASYNISTQKEIKSIWDAAKGVYLFRNNFRILPYGPDRDWLDFTSRSQRAKANIYKNHTVSGYVQLDSISSENLKEQTNRQGLILDEYGSNFITIMKDVIAYIAFKYDTEIREGFNYPDIQENDTEIRTNNGSIIFHRIIDTSEKKENLINEIGTKSSKIVNNSEVPESARITSKEIETKIKELTIILNEEKNEQKQRTFEYERKLDYFKSLVGLAGQSIIVESLTHELHRIEESVTSYAEDTLQKIEDISNETDSSISYEELLDNQDKIIQQIDYLKQQLAHIEPTYKRNRMIVENIKIRSFLEGLYKFDSPMSKKASECNIRVIFEGNDFEIKGNKGMLITIFDNLFLNSIYWLNFAETSNAIIHKEIHFKIDSNNRTIEIWDNGIGIHHDIENDLFLPEKSMKENGRGLGLFISMELVNYLNGQIALDKVNRNEFSNLYKFFISFPDTN